MMKQTRQLNLLKRRLTVLCTTSLLISNSVFAMSKKPNVIVIYADDISARELPSYGSSQWAGYHGKNGSDPAYRAKTPVLEKLATQGVQIETAWAATICSPSRAMMMTGRYAHLHKWWHNGDYGRLPHSNQGEDNAKSTNTNANKKAKQAHLYQSSPLLIGHVAKEAGYATMWSGKTQMKDADLTKFGFDEGLFSAGTELQHIGELPKNPYTNFVVSPRDMTQEEKQAWQKKLSKMKKKPKKQVGIGDGQVAINEDTGDIAPTFARTTWLFKPSIVLMNHPQSKKQYEWWPNTTESRKNYGINTYGPDVELEFVFDFMQRQQAKGKPFFVYHTSHLGHGMFDFLFPEQKNIWPGTPVIKWDGKGYTRTTPNITGEKGQYNTHGTVTPAGMKYHVEYLDYQVWLYLEKLAEMGIENDTILIFASDNGSSKYGKGSEDRQKGTHVPLIVYAPGANLTKQGKLPELASIADILPTLADIMGIDIAEDYEINGESLWPFLTSDKPHHRNWTYGYKKDAQLIRGHRVMLDGNKKWWDVTTQPADLISYPEITDWSKVSAAHRAERDALLQELKGLDKYHQEHDLVRLPTYPKVRAKQ
ncbi:sulfatase-like hydrolase/transferase [Paraglaciecola aquimarina]|uniref:Sulfatase-like hydrolase/transferase n=1 Tax=Paraglaciecola aquimarina TaxID=1235557 RepID=A0ABU3SXK6_9ALTE|nr:sulfatase-like hydrolase/transferase [Paraglaciecola aquimarina]MDU0354748.1 sulfatase-like hydrolase/transferase [Paraglaciecola aquimarina]